MISLLNAGDANQDRLRAPQGWLTLREARLHNLKGVDARFPLGTFICVTGVSGSGKSSLITQTLSPALARVLHNAQAILRHRIDQLLTEDEPVLESVMAWTLDADSASSVDLFAAYISLRAEILSRLDDAGHHEFWNTGRHEEWGRVTLAEQVSYFANHEPTHLGQLADAAG